MTIVPEQRPQESALYQWLSIVLLFGTIALVSPLLLFYAAVATLGAPRNARMFSLGALIGGLAVFYLRH